MAVKQPTFTETRSFLVMKKLKGKEFFEILEADRNPKKSFSLTIEQRLDLTKALLIALKEQVSDRGIIHRDIKPENILVDLTKPITVNIIDYGLSTDAEKPKSMNCGTRGYMAPEIESKPNKPTRKSDVFSMAKTIAWLWGINDIHKLPSNLASALFKGMDFIGLKNKKDITILLSNMLQKDPEKRWSIKQSSDFAKKITPLGPRVDFSTIKEFDALNVHRKYLLRVLGKLQINDSTNYSEEEVSIKKQEIQQHFEAQKRTIAYDNLKNYSTLIDFSMIEQRRGLELYKEELLLMLSELRGCGYIEHEVSGKQAEIERCFNAQMQKITECEQLKTIFKDYIEHLDKKLIQKKFKSEPAKIQQKLINRYNTIKEAYAEIQHKGTLSDSDKNNLRKAINTCINNNPEWSEKSYLTKIIDVLSVGITAGFKFVYRLLRSEEFKFQKKLQEKINPQEETNKGPSKK